MENEKVNILDRQNKVTDIITLRELLSGNHVFRIPDYQRGYAWRKEFIDLWTDILRLYRADVENRKHYTGMLALEELNENEKDHEMLGDTNAFYVVDGQQRITSLIIIIKKMIKYLTEEEYQEFDKHEYELLLKTEEDEDRFGYSLNRNDGLKDYFENRVLKDITNDKHTNQYKANINDASCFIEKELLKFDAEEVCKILGLILDRIVFNLYFVTDDFDVRVTFETMNNRGKKLSKLELLKNRLMYLSTFLSKKDVNKIKMQINESWKEVYDNLSFGDCQLSDDEYLKAHWIVYKRLQKHKGDAFIDDILEEYFTIDKGEFYKFLSTKDFKGAFNYLLSYIKSLSDYSKYWSFVNVQESKNLNIEAEETAWIKRFARLTNNLYVRATLMVVLAEADLSFAVRKEFYSCLEKFIFVNKLIAQERKNDLGFIVTYARELMSANSNEKITKLNNINKQINQHDLAITEKRIPLVLQEFKNFIESHSKFYYEWAGLKYFLYEYNDWLQKKTSSAATIEWYKLEDVSIEHVLPQTPDKEYYKVAFKNYIGTEQFVRITNSLGNLLLLSSGSENSSLKNYSYPVKRDMKIDSGRFSYTHGSSSAIKIAENECWTPKQIYERSKELFDFLFENWFKNIEGFDKAEWDRLIEQNNLINFNYSPLVPKEQEDLEKKLKDIDVSGEVREFEKSCFTKTNSTYYEDEFKEYFDNDVIKIRVNSKQTRKIEDVFTVVIKKGANGEPEKLSCGTMEDGAEFLISYYFSSNKFYVENTGVEPHYSYKKEEIKSEKINRFVRSFGRYLKKRWKKSLEWGDPVETEA